jgi:hypothetical protein
LNLRLAAASSIDNRDLLRDAGQKPRRRQQQKQRERDLPPAARHAMTARRAPNGATKLDTGAIMANPMIDTNPSDNGGSSARRGSPAMA